MKKTLIVDIETSPNLAYVWEKYEQDVIAFEKERELICFAYKWLGEKSIKVHSKGEMSEKELVKKLHSLFDEAECIVAHNGDQFDIKMANAFFIHEGLTPPSPYRTIDTLKIARNKFKFNSNKLNDLGEYLGLGKKVETGGFKLWLGCLNGDKKSWKLMKKYNVGDIVLLEKVFLRLMPWAPNNTSIAEAGMVCPSCGGTHLQYRGYSINKLFISRRIQCQSCGRWATSNKKLRLLDKDSEYVK